MQYAQLTDEELLLAHKRATDNTYLGILLHRYTTLLFGVALKYLKDKTLAEDAVQQIFLKALTHFPKEDINNFKGWLYILMRNYCLQELRDKIRNTDDAILAYIPATNTDNDELMKQEYSIQQLDIALTELTQEQRTTIELFYLKKYSYEQIIDQTGFTFMQVKSYIQNGKRNLKALLLKKMSKQHE